MPLQHPLESRTKTSGGQRRAYTAFTPHPEPHEHRGGLQGRGGLTAPHAPGKKRDREGGRNEERREERKTRRQKREARNEKGELENHKISEVGGGDAVRSRAQNRGDRGRRYRILFF